MIGLDFETIGLEPERDKLRLVQVATSKGTRVHDAWDPKVDLDRLLAALAFFLFTRPTGPDATWRGIVVAPVIGAVIGLLGTIAQTRLPQFIVVLVAVSAAMLMMRLLDVAVASVLVIVLLPIIHGSLTGPPPGEPQHNPFPIYTYWYPVWILVYTALLFLIFKAWCRTLPSEERTPRRT